MKRKILCAYFFLLMMLGSPTFAQDAADQQQIPTLDPASPPVTDLTEEEKKALLERLQNQSNRPRNDLDADEIDHYVLLLTHVRAQSDPSKMQETLGLTDRQFSNVMEVLDDVRNENRAHVAKQVLAMCDQWRSANTFSQLSESNKIDLALAGYDRKDQESYTDFLGKFQSAIAQIHSIIGPNRAMFDSYLNRERINAQGFRIYTFSDTLKNSGQAKETIEHHCN